MPHWANFVKKIRSTFPEILCSNSGYPQISAHQGISRTSELLRREYGSTWREQISNHSVFPDGPDFVDPSKPKPANQPVQPAPSQPAPTPKPTQPAHTPKNKPTPAKHEEKSAPSETAKTEAPSPKPAPEPKKPAPKPTEAPKTTPKAAPTSEYKMPTKEEQYAKFKDQGNWNSLRMQSSS